MGIDLCNWLSVVLSLFPSVKSTLKDEVIERVVFLKEVTQHDLRRKFICFAQNSIGNTSQSIQLREKKGGKPGRLSQNTGNWFYLRGEGLSTEWWWWWENEHLLDTRQCSEHFAHINAWYTLTKAPQLVSFMWVIQSCSCCLILCTGAVLKPAIHSFTHSSFLSTNT